jgi:hypothetical protein
MASFFMYHDKFNTLATNRYFLFNLINFMRSGTDLICDKKIADYQLIIDEWNSKKFYFLTTGLALVLIEFIGYTLLIITFFLKLSLFLNYWFISFVSIILILSISVSSILLYMYNRFKKNMLYI